MYTIQIRLTVTVADGINAAEAKRQIINAIDSKDIDVDQYVTEYVAR